MSGAGNYNTYGGSFPYSSVNDQFNNLYKPAAQQFTGGGQYGRWNGTNNNFLGLMPSVWPSLFGSQQQPQGQWQPPWGGNGGGFGSNQGPGSNPNLPPQAPGTPPPAPGAPPPPQVNKPFGGTQVPPFNLYPQAPGGVYNAGPGGMQGGAPTPPTTPSNPVPGGGGTNPGGGFLTKPKVNYGTSVPGPGMGGVSGVPGMAPGNFAGGGGDPQLLSQLRADPTMAAGILQGKFGGNQQAMNSWINATNLGTAQRNWNTPQQQFTPEQLRWANGG